MPIELLNNNINPIHLSEVVSFLRQVDALFQPALSIRIDLNKFSLKLIESSEIIYLKNEHGNIVGLTAFYANNIETKIAYISLLIVIPACQGCNLSKVMLKRCLERSKEIGMKFVDLHTNCENLRALNLYESLGFQKMSYVEGEKLHYRLDISRW